MTTTESAVTPRRQVASLGADGGEASGVTETIESLTGWGRTAPSRATVRRTPRWTDPVVLDGVGPRGAVPRGLGRAYGAAAQNAGGHVFEYCNDSGAIFLDPTTGIVEVDAGVSLAAVIGSCVPRGWFVPVTPGTRHVTVGGAIASDVHGKNHHVDGSFGAHVEWLDILLSNGETIRLSPTVRPDWFWATVGGMGLTGVIVRAALRMLPVSSPLMRVETQRTRGLDDVLDLMSGDGDDDHRYSVAWIDLLARGDSLGRGVLTRGDHAPGDGSAEPYDPGRTWPGPPWAPGGLLNRHTMGAFNRMWYAKAPAEPTWGDETIRGFFHPLDAVSRWNRLYGRRGFVQYQIIVPLDATDALREIIASFSEAQVASFLAVLKRMGPSNPAPLSFPTSGWTLTLDCPARTRGLAEAFHVADRITLGVGGRHYLAKDSHITPEAVRAGYPRLGEWRKVRDEMDPRGLWRSDLSRRLGLT